MIDRILKIAQSIQSDKNMVMNQFEILFARAHIKAIAKPPETIY
jgi:hypothetical protein